MPDFDTTDTERWQRVSDLMNAGLERPLGERDAFLRRECGNDDALRARVEALMAADARAGEGFMAQPMFSLQGDDTADAGDSEEASPSNEAGQRIGPYRLLRRIGKGGMGAVYLAERVDGGFEQRVAIKVLKRGIDTEEVVRRFQAERQILAGLDHPNIARLFDGGSTANGLPYLAMEHVEGQRIDTFCSTHRLDLRARVALLETVCEAVHHAHQNLVVHRDLKPSNILVTAGGVPKLLDFGVAKLLDDGVGALVTRTALPAPMTPQYASPEQVRGGPITTATDVYALGLLLYELLAGVRPYDADTLAHSSIERTVCEIMPTRPSAAVQLSGAVAEVGLPPTERSRLARRLRGDLDTIVLRALAKEPERRYASAEQLGDDLRRYLGDLPVRARRDTFLYRTGKLLRRHPWRVGAAGAIATLVVGFAIVMTVQRTEIARQRDEVAHQASVAVTERDRAEEVTDFLIRFLRVPDPSRGSGADLTVREALDNAADALTTSLHDRPATRAELLDVIGRVLSNLGLYEDASPRLEEGLAIRRATLEGFDPKIAESAANLGLLRRRQKQWSEAEALYGDAIGMLRTAYPDGHADLARTLNNLASLLRSRRRGEEAEPLVMEALAMQERLLGADHLDVARTLNTLGTLARYRGDREIAEVRYRRSIAIRGAHPGDDEVGLAKVLNNLAQLLVDRGALEEVIELHRTSLALRARLYAGDHIDRLTSLNNLGLTVALAGDGRVALAKLDEALAMSERLGQGGNAVGKNRAFALSVMGRYQDCVGAADAVRAALAADAERGLVAEVEGVRAGCQAALGAFAEAEPVLRSSFEVLVETRGVGAWQVRVARERLVAAYDAVGRAEDAARLRGEVEE